MKYSPKPQKRQAITVAFILIAVAVVTYFFSNSGLSSPLPLQIISMACLCAATYILVRYYFTGITYILRPSDNASGDIIALPRDKVDFCVIRSQGKREGITECLLSLDRLISVGDFSDESLKALNEKHGKLSVYYYTVKMFKENRQALIFNDSGTVLCIIIEADDRFISMLSSFVPSDNTNM